jgi:SAM-dependent methyltransferase
MSYPYADGLASIGNTAIKKELANVVANSHQLQCASTLIDVGCGDGVVSERLAAILSEVRLWILLDRDRTLAAKARHRVALAAGGGTVIALCGDIDDLPLADRIPRNSIILASHVLYYSITRSPESALGHLLRIASSSEAQLIVVLRTRDHASYRLRSRYNSAIGEGGANSMESSQVERWLHAWGKNFTSSLVQTVLPTNIPINDHESTCDLLGKSSVLCDIVSFLCHSDLRLMSHDIRLSVADELMNFKDQGQLVLPISESVIVIPSGPSKKVDLQPDGVPPLRQCLVLWMTRMQASRLRLPGAALSPPGETTVAPDARITPRRPLVTTRRWPGPRPAGYRGAE